MNISKEAIEPSVLAQFDLDNFDEEVRMDEEAWKQAIANGYCAVYVARNEQEEIAAVLVLKTSTVNTGSWYFYSVAVAEKYRKMGLSTRMFNEAIRGEVAYGFINSHCHVGNDASIALHKSLSFTAIEYVPDFYGACEDAILWRRQR